MYLHTSEGLGQEKLPSIQDTPCLQDAVPWMQLGNSIVHRELNEFHFRDPNLRTWHKAWIKNHLIPAILKSWQTTRPIRTIVLVGNADSVGNQSFNYALGLKRAKAVRKRISDGIKAKRPDLLDKIKIEVFSQGECWPLGKRQRSHRVVSLFATDKTVSK